MRNRLLTILCFLLAFTATAAAQGAALDPDQSWIDMLRPVYDAVMHGNGWLAAFLALIPLTAAVHKYLPDKFGGTFVRANPFGKIASAFVLSFAGAGATSLGATGSVMTAAVALAAAKVALLAAGGFKVLHELAKALIATAWFQTKAPAWLKYGVTALLSFIGSDAIAKAEAAGKSAVEASPAPGNAATTGPGVDI